MKILHTSDWHLGHVLYGFPQDDQQKKMLDQMVELVKEHQPDAFLISGDVYDTTQPSASVQTMLSDALVAIHEANPTMQIVCIAGNHDSGSRHMIFHKPWEALKVKMIGNVNKDSDLSDYIVKIDGVGYVVAVPYAADRFMPEDIYVKLSNLVAEQNQENLPVFLMGHLAISCDYTGHEQSTDDCIGGITCVTTDTFGRDYDYVALGHIHKQQKVDNNDRVWYCGTPIAVSFDESTPGNDHGALLVECEAHGADVKITHLHIKNPKPLVNIPAEGVGEWKNVLEEFKKYPSDEDAFIRLNVEVEKYLPAGATEEARAVAKSKNCTFCLINTRRKEDKTASASASEKTFTTTEFRNIDPIDVAKMFIREKFKGSEEHDSEIEELLKIVKETLNTETEE